MPDRPQRLRTPDGKMNGISVRLRMCRKAAKLTQDQLCARIAIASNAGWNPVRGDIVKIEIGTRTCTDLETLVLAMALGCDPAWLFRGDKDAFNGENIAKSDK